MTTRVQKGGPIFRPVAKSRTRPSSSAPRQLSSTPFDNGSFTASGRQADANVDPEGSALMPPPSSIPYRSASVESSTSFTVPFNHPSASLFGTGNGSLFSDTMAQSTVTYNSAENRNYSNVLPSVASHPMPTANIIQTPISSISTPTGFIAVPSRHSASPATLFSATTPAMFLTSPPMSNGLVAEGGPADMQQFVASSNSSTNPLVRNQAEIIGESTIVDSELAAHIGDTFEGNALSARKRFQSATPQGESESRPRKRRAAISVDDDLESGSDDATTSTKARRKRKLSTKPRVSRKSRGPSHPPFDSSADPGEEVDPTVITMADLCSDTGQGRVSTKAAQILDNHAAWKASNRERRARMRMIMEQKKLGKEDVEENQTPQNSAANDIVGDHTSPVPGTSRDSPGAEDESGNGFDYSQNLATSRFNVQVRIGPNGETIIDEESLFVDRENDEETDNYTHVVESDTSKFVNSASYGKKYRGSRWSAIETEEFYNALQQFGENYELISYLIPGRDRKACKNKFKAEDKKDPARITYCLNNRIPVDVATLSKMTGKDFSGPTPDIRAPTPVTLDDSAPPAPVEPPSLPTHTVKKRSRSRSQNVSATEGEQIIGSLDAFNPEDN